MKSGLKRDAFMVKNGGVFNTPILISKAEMRKSLVPSRFQSIEKEPQLQYISYHNYGSYLWEDYKIDFFALLGVVFVPLRKILNFQS